MSSRKTLFSFLIVAIVSTTLWSGYAPESRTDWLAEFIAIPIGIAVWWSVVGADGFQKITSITLIIWSLMIVLHLIGAHYEYVDVPWFSWLRDEFGLQRNNFDKLAHFVMGMAAYLCVREVACNSAQQKRVSLQVFSILLLLTLGFGAAAELYEWIAVLLMNPKEGIDYLGTQGDIWDTQSDMALAPLGGMIAEYLFGKIQDDQIQNISTALRTSLQRFALRFSSICLIFILGCYFVTIAHSNYLMKSIAQQDLPEWVDLGKSDFQQNDQIWSSYVIRINGELYNSYVRIPPDYEYILIVFPGLYSGDKSAFLLSGEAKKAVIIALEYPETRGRRYYRLQKSLGEIQQSTSVLANMVPAARIYLQRIQNEFALRPVPVVSTGISLGAFFAYQFAAVESRVSAIVYALGFSSMENATALVLQYEMPKGVFQSLLSKFYAMQFSYLDPGYWEEKNIDKPILFVNAGNETKLSDTELSTFVNAHHHTQVVSLPYAHMDFFKKTVMHELTTTVENWLNTIGFSQSSSENESSVLEGRS